MAGETFSCWSTQVNKDALFVTAILLLKHCSPFRAPRYSDDIPRTRPNFSLSPSLSFISVFPLLPEKFQNIYIYTRVFEKKRDKDKKDDRYRRSCNNLNT